MTTNNEIFKTTKISCTSRASVNIGKSYFTFECTEERSVNPNLLPENEQKANEIINNEYNALWDTVNNQVDNMVAEVKSYENTK